MSQQQHTKEELAEYFTPTPTNYIPPSTPDVNSLISHQSIELEAPLPPKYDFIWPEIAITISSKLKSLGFIHYQREEYPTSYMPFLTFNNHHVGREQGEVWYYIRNSNPTNETSNGFPDLTILTNGNNNNHVVFQNEKDNILIITLLHFGPHSCGHEAIVHGGICASIADVLQYYAYTLGSNRCGVTATLNLSYKAPTPIDKVVISVSTAEIQGERKGATKLATFDETFNTNYFNATGLFVTPVHWIGKNRYEVQEMNRIQREKTKNELLLQQQQLAQQQQQQQQNVVATTTDSESTNTSSQPQASEEKP